MINRVDVALLLGVWHVNSTDCQIISSYIGCAAMRGLTARDETHIHKHPQAHTHTQISENDKMYLTQYSPNQFWLPLQVDSFLFFAESYHISFFLTWTVAMLVSPQALNVSYCCLYLFSTWNEQALDCEGLITVPCISMVLPAQSKKKKKQIDRLCRMSKVRQRCRSSPHYMGTITLGCGGL